LFASKFGGFGQAEYDPLFLEQLFAFIKYLDSFSLWSLVLSYAESSICKYPQEYMKSFTCLL